MLHGQRVGKDVELGGRLAERHAGPQASGHREHLLEPVGQQVRPPRLDERARGGGDEKLRGHEAEGPAEVLRHDPDDGHVRRPKAHDLSDDSRIPAEPRPPGVMGQDDEGRIAGTAPFPGEERAAEHGVQLQYVEVVVADVLDLDPLRRATPDRQQLFRHGVRGQTFEDVVALPVVEVLRVGQWVREDRRMLVELRDGHELVGIGHGQRLKEHRVRHGGDRRGGSDADRQRQHRRRRETGLPRKAAQADPQIDPQVVEPRQAALVAQRLHGLGNAAQAHARHPRGLGSRVALRTKLLLGLLEMKAQLALEIVIGRVAPERAPQAMPALAKNGHRDLPVTPVPETARR